MACVITKKGMVELFGQLLRFGAVGGAATIVHTGIFMLLAEKFLVGAFAAHCAGFAVAVAVSFVGHFYWTFQMGHRTDEGAMAKILIKFAVTALTGFAINSFGVIGIVYVFGGPNELAAAFFMFVTPLSIYLLSKFWVFS